VLTLAFGALGYAITCYFEARIISKVNHYETPFKAMANDNSSFIDFGLVLGIQLSSIEFLDLALSKVLSPVWLPSKLIGAIDTALDAPNRCLHYFALALRCL